ncbi:MULTISPECIES: cob(I)yrinic acid a,c-diamide adenosyltransferase [Mycolicibacterium]|jgi:cob(I)alamin adenosyltransferase|uniref:Cob(I)yrinic acid a,c-diamide adenosyltransferase n=1 Tax=Mycolicibacterium vanbaalenii (strain DSM 7251 / JCM 13017 / BCRC 16820 / KCTC 9966 / NRRL B-24157 / PYR-1) TaxID=350058 RepID=A1T7G7_MYCVP|nr:MULTISPECIES: cob(I)yrinic acid a,c-diamide adenosyltransferase [Mycolicibacterium]ABM13117.1 cob(I)yrinic acid a,c-diamide adenosyltransferase [Mycolicibacterium vanbaalenii PYR-1]MCV7130829.1 cob(I)yrinic acid a,c-diamide adenosyltransferase [Mycolicibacterium vanbaalenii PYR-1]MDW5613220.1 cob(I)yrinic acid a,c-diamide adenosyltransferase [Mycolicibacterium sp. D5.8-2]PQP49495.1 cob(I)yrinic acid a,c-diamide adenosyltransferase [Mycolicibacterium austroafricanum]QZT59086.1 cob(I)yrinic a
MPQGSPLTVPDDGLTTRARRNAPLLAVHTGPGKGKSTAAFGMALRAWNQGFDIAVFQFVKSAKWKVGEETALRELGRAHDERGVGGPVEWHKMGSGWSWTRKAGTEIDHASAAADGWAEISRRLSEERHDFYVLDEFTYPLKWGWLDVDDVVSTLTARPGTQHVVITGRDAPQALVDAADLVTEMTKVKHPMDVGRKGQKGIEW